MGRGFGRLPSSRVVLPAILVSALTLKTAMKDSRDNPTRNGRSPKEEKFTRDFGESRLSLLSHRGDADNTSPYPSTDCQTLSLRASTASNLPCPPALTAAPHTGKSRTTTFSIQVPYSDSNSGLNVKWGFCSTSTTPVIKCYPELKLSQMSFLNRRGNCF